VDVTDRERGTGEPPRRLIARTRLDRVRSLTAGERGAMLALMQRYYDGVTAAQFDRDLGEKRFVIRMLDAQGGLCGFSTIQELRLDHEGVPIRVVFSGDTVIDRACWGQKNLQRAFTRYLIRCLILEPRRRLYWFLLSKGYKTYLLMRHNLESYPNCKRATPPDFAAILELTARHKFGERYDAARGVLPAEGDDAQTVKEGFREVTPAELADPEIAFFVQKNPGYARGDELCCLAIVRWRELLWAAVRYSVAVPMRRLLGGRRRAARRLATASAAPAEASPTSGPGPR